MTTGKEGLLEHLKSGATTTCRAWKVVRKDGFTLGFTDHDRDIQFDGLIFQASSGMTPGVIQQSSGLAVDNTEIMGALSDASISEDDLKAGRFDGAELTAWTVNWQDPSERMIRFRGTFGEVQYSGNEFRVELRGLTEPLNHHRGRVFQPDCFAIFGDSSCKVNKALPAYSTTTTILALGRDGKYLLPALGEFPSGHFSRGTMEVVSGRAQGQTLSIREDKLAEGGRTIDLMVTFPIAPAVGDQIRITAGCDKSAAMCREKFANFLNFRGFPHIPGADWMSAYPTANMPKDGGSRYK